jgi:hypothetical protein
MGNLTSIKLPKQLVERLKAHKRPHQALAGVIEELLNEANNKNHNDTAKADRRM